MTVQADPAKRLIGECSVIKSDYNSSQRAVSTARRNWSVRMEIGHSRESSLQRFVKLLNPQPRVSRTLEVTGMNVFFEIHTDREAAIASFG